MHSASRERLGEEIKSWDQSFNLPKYRMPQCLLKILANSFSTISMLLLSRFSLVRVCATPQTAAHQLPHPWDSPGKNTGVGCHFLLQCMKVKSESEVAQSSLTLRDPMDCSLPGSSIHGIFPGKSSGVGCHCLLCHFIHKRYIYPQSPEP